MVQVGIKLEIPLAQPPKCNYNPVPLYSQTLSYIFSAESLCLVALWSPSSDFPEACYTQVPRDRPDLSTTWYLALFSACGTMSLAMPCDCHARLFTRAKDRCQGQSLAVSGSNFHVATPQRSVYWEWNGLSYTAQRETKLDVCFHFDPQTHTSSREKKQRITLPSPGGPPAEEDTRSYSLKLGTGLSTD